MGKRSKRDAPRITEDASALTSNPFAGLAGLAGAAPDEPAEPESSPPDDAPPDTTSSERPWQGRPKALTGKLVITRERKGHGGKTVTRLTGVALPPAELETLTRALRRAFGCGGQLDGGDVVLAGARQQQLADWLRAEGATRVVIGS
ncbi:MAG: translation initiation factor [Myxococcales bacterium]|nr:translation initiation factor [Myxococcales bacterium]